MDAIQLKAVQDPLKEKYRKDPGSALITLKAQSKVGEGISCKIETGKMMAEAGLHPATGGDGAWSMKRAVITLVAVSVVMAVVAEGLVGVAEEVGRQWGLNEVFLGVVVLAMIGNAAENSAAVRFARRGRMDLALNIVTQASVQIALFVTPILVLLSFPMGHPLDLVFSTFELMSVVLAVAIVAYLVLNGETNWFEGVQLLALYAMIAVAIYFLP